MAAQLWLTKQYFPGQVAAGSVVGAGGAGTAPGSPSVAPAGPLQVGDGINAAYSVFSQATASNVNGISLSISDVIAFFQLPEGAVVLEGYLCGVIKTAGTVLKAGLGTVGFPTATGTATDGDFIAAITYSTTRILTRFLGVPAGLPYFPAAIAAATQPKWNNVTVTVVSGVSTGSVSLGMYILYSVAQPSAVTA